ncbi:MAG: RsmB/NOP family class I SAM-dependent RNA methyltransferase [Neisseriales bacterium]|nr:MAG: RsmB/NOP family class I SAM-dependent RNA methyltransferase [Neisseriales bacterium]
MAKIISSDLIKETLTAICDAYSLSVGASQGVIDSFYNDKLSAFRVNTLKASIADVLAGLKSNSIEVSPINWSDISYTLKDKSLLSRSSFTRDGLVYIQNLSSQLTALLLDAKPDEFVLDLAAAPGGKTSFIAAMMQNNGRISAVEPVKDRYFRMMANLKSLGVTICKCYQKDGRVVGKLCKEWFDKVLLDAPCSSMAQIDLREADSYSHWSMKKVKECSRKQKQLILSAFESLKPGGEMIYSTCSWMVEENEEVVNHLLNEYSDQLEVVDLDLPIENYLPGLTNYNNASYHEAITKTRRIIPNQWYEAFYIAKIRKLIR